MSSIVYLIIDKLKRDILHELSSICTDENELKEVIDLYFKEYDLILSLPKKSSEVYRDRKKYDLKDIWMNTNLMCLGEKTSSILNEIKWKKIFLFNPGEEEYLLYKI